MSRIKKIIKSIKRKEMIPIVNPVEKDELLKDNVAFITGGSGGIGKSIAAKFINCGCKVIISGTNEKKLEELCKSLGENCRYIVVDLNKIDTFENKIKDAINIFGKIDILVNSAGVHIERGNQDFLNFTEDEFAAQITCSR